MSYKTLNFSGPWNPTETQPLTMNPSSSPHHQIQSQTGGRQQIITSLPVRSREPIGAGVDSDEGEYDFHVVPPVCTFSDFRKGCCLRVFSNDSRVPPHVYRKLNLLSVLRRQLLGY